jgi:hypothetical protein
LRSIRPCFQAANQKPKPVFINTTTSKMRKGKKQPENGEGGLDICAFSIKRVDTHQREEEGSSMSSQLLRVIRKVPDFWLVDSNWFTQGNVFEGGGGVDEHRFCWFVFGSPLTQGCRTKVTRLNKESK